MAITHPAYFDVAVFDFSAFDTLIGAGAFPTTSSVTSSERTKSTVSTGGRTSSTVSVDERTRSTVS